MKPGNEDATRLLGRLAENIDGILDAEMSSALQNLVGSGPAIDGDLSDRDMPILLGRAFSDGTTGRLRVTDGTVEKSVYFEAGLPVMAASTDASDRMLAMLVREGVIDARQNEEAVRVVDATGRKVGAVLVDLGFLRSDELLPSVRRHYESIIVSLFSWPAGRWYVDAGVTAGPDRTRLLRHPAVLVREGIDNGYPFDRISSRLGLEQNVLLLDNSASADDIVAQVVADRSEMRLVTLFDGVRSIEDVARASSISEEMVLRIAFTLFCFGALHPLAAAGTGRASARVGVRDFRIDRERVHSRYALAVESDYFGFLGVDRTADSTEIRRAYEKLRKEIAPETLGPELWHELKEQIETVQEVLEESLRILCSKSLRAAYEFNLAHGPDAETAPDDGAGTTGAPSPTALSRG
jgi:DnaJ-domain-containing protein 1